MADKGYQGEAKFIVPFEGKDLKEGEYVFNQWVHATREVVEHPIGKLKHFQCFRY